MEKMSSTEFRRRYATLTEPVLVMALGHPVGEWFPFQMPERVRTSEQRAPYEDIAVDRLTGGHKYEFRPAPKPSQKAKV